VTSVEPKAMRTAEIVANQFGVEVTGIEGLQEIDRPVLPIMPRDEHARFNARLFEQFETPVIGAESARAAVERFSLALGDVVGSDAASNVVVVTHGTVIALFTAAHNPLDAFHLWQQLECSMFVVLALPSFQLLEIVNPIS
jgi:broad specificity phosphatase PhoE